MRFRSETIADAPLDDVWAWWTDFGAAGDRSRVSHGMGASKRVVLEASPTRVVLEERAPVGNFRLARREVEILPSEHRLEEHVDSAVSMSASWRFEAANAGRATRIVRETTVHHRALDAMGALARRAAEAVAQRDLEHHVHEMERDLGR